MVMLEAQHKFFFSKRIEPCNLKEKFMLNGSIS